MDSWRLDYAKIVTGKALHSFSEVLYTDEKKCQWIMLEFLDMCLFIIRDLYNGRNCCKWNYIFNKRLKNLNCLFRFIVLTAHVVVMLTAMQFQICSKRIAFNWPKWNPQSNASSKGSMLDLFYNIPQWSTYVRICSLFKSLLPVLQKIAA